MTVAPDKNYMLQTKTRFEFFTELLDKYGNAVETVKKAYYKFPSDADKLKLARLEAFVKILKAEMETQTEMDMNIWKLREEINALPKPKKEVVEATTEATTETKDKGN